MSGQNSLSQHILILYWFHHKLSIPITQRFTFSRIRDVSCLILFFSQGAHLAFPQRIHSVELFWVGNGRNNI